MSNANMITLLRKPDGSTVRMMPDGTERPYSMQVPDYAALDAMTGEDIARQIASDPDVAPDMSNMSLIDSLTYSGQAIRAVRKRMGLTQAAFAAMIGVPIGTVRHWEQGTRRPSGASRALLLVLEKEPEAVKRALAVA